MTAGVAARRCALEVLERIDTGGAYANRILSGALERAGLDQRDRALVTELVYGVTRRRRALDHRLEPYLMHPPPPLARAALRLGVYQLEEMALAPHAAVATTVGAVPRRWRGLVNAVLRRVADAPEPEWPDDATRLSYPDWIVDRLSADLGADRARRALEVMNLPAEVHRRADGYVQDPSSRLVVDAVPLDPGDRVLDLCAAPGGKATGLAARGASVVAADIRPGRARLIVDNLARSSGLDVTVAVADGTRPPFAPDSFHAVLVDAPCSGLGALRRRPDARWRIAEADVASLARLQRDLLVAARRLVAPGGYLVYSVCTLTRAETVEVAEAVGEGLEVVGVDAPWEPWGTGGVLLPDAGHDGMALFCWRRP